MALDPLEKDRLRRKMAQRMGIFLESGNSVSCVSGHYTQPPASCELCQTVHADQLLVIKNRSGKKMHVDADCLREMLRFQVVEDVEDFPRWLEKMKELRADWERRRGEEARQREEERRRLEKKVIVRKRDPQRTA